MNASTSPGFLQRTLVNLRSAWRAISQSARAGQVPNLHPDLPDRDRNALRRQMQECLDARGGEVSARARAAALGQSYLNLNEKGCRRFLEVLAEDFAVDRAALTQTARELGALSSPEEWSRMEARLREILTPPRLKLLTQFNSLPEGVKFLVNLRADLLDYSANNPSLASLDEDLRTLLASWFDVGFLDLRRITWEAPAALLERLAAYEAVHAIQSWQDLKSRLAGNRRCYAFFHPRMQDEPLIFVEVALASGMASNIQTLLDETIPSSPTEDVDTALFYSISNTQKGLRGVNFGSFLIKRVIDQLLTEVPGLKRFATLSPIPGFRRYLDARMKAGGDGLLTPAEDETLKATLLSGGDGGMSDLLGRRDWHLHAQIAAALRAPLTRLCAQYLVEERDNGRALDRVAHFHLNNGARIDRINWLADTSPKGLRSSFGLMVNYRYKLADIENNHEAYRTSGEVAISSEVKRLLRPKD